MLERYRIAFFDYISLTMKLGLVFALIRVLEYTYFSFVYPEYLNVQLFFQGSLNNDFWLIMAWSLCYFPIHIALNLLHANSFSLISFKVLSFLFILLNLVLTNFFMIAHFLMPAFVVDFTMQDLGHVALMELNAKNWSIWLLDAIVLLSTIILFRFNLFKGWFTKHPLTQKSSILLYGIIALIVLGNTRSFQKKQDQFEHKFEFFIGNSKITELIFNVYFRAQTKGLSEIKNDEELTQSIEVYQGLRPQWSYTSPVFPFMRFGAEENVLGPFFNESSRAPNIVLVISESLSSTFSGKKTLYGSMTPFLDSLTEHSLYWENFVSNVDRSFGVWTNLLASLPYGEVQRGFINKVEVMDSNINYAQHLNLIQILKDNHYKSHFFYGGWIGYDNMIEYMRFLKVDLTVDEDQYGKTYFKKDPENNASGFKVDNVWGFDDAQVFKRSFEDIDLVSDDQPMINIYMTLTNHLPFVTADAKFYDLDYQDSILKKQGCDPEKFEIISRVEIACILFADNALRELFLRYKKRKDFENTIFIIVGDHGGGSLAITDRMASYRVPLLIYSNLLKKPARFKGISSHIDILPSLQNLLQNTFNLDVPYLTPYLGEGLDTSRVFSANRMVPMNIFDNDRINFMLDDLILEQGFVYTFDEDFNFSPCKDEAKIKRIKDAYVSYLRLNNYTISKNRIWDINYMDEL